MSGELAKSGDDNAQPSSPDDERKSSRTVNGAGRVQVSPK